MNKTIASVAGILSIALFSSAVTTTALADSSNYETTSIISNSSVKTAPPIKPKALTVAVAQAPKVVRSYNHPTMHGYEESTYRGKYYYEDQESWRKCVMDRESSFRYGAKNGQGSSAAGAYQFLDRSWRSGLAHMIFPELKKDYGVQVSKQIRNKLMDTPIYKWSREMQDRGFFTVLNYEEKWSGKHHWNATVPGTSCGSKSIVVQANYRNKNVSAEYKRATSKKANDLHGYEQSLYRGKYYSAGQESWRKCVMWRESNYNYNLIGAGYNWPYHGAYQFHNVNWKRGLIIMMAKESKETKDGLNGEARRLKHKNINQWNRYWQDRALFTALNYNGLWSGAHHWNATRGGC